MLDEKNHRYLSLDLEWPVLSIQKSEVKRQRLLCCKVSVVSPEVRILRFRVTEG